MSPKRSSVFYLLASLLLSMTAAGWLGPAQRAGSDTAAAQATPPAPQPAAQADTSPPLPEEARERSHGSTQMQTLPGSPPGALKAVLIRSWGNCSGNRLIWEQLNDGWQTYGRIPLWVDYAHPGLCDGPVTYEKLAASGAHVLLLSNPSGGGKQFSSSEIEAIRRYLQEGHGLVGTYAVFRFSGIDNRFLAPLFGIAASTFNASPAPVTPVYRWSLFSPLSARLSDPYTSAGYAYAQLPANGGWDAHSLQGAQYAARTFDQRAALTVYDADAYRAVYIANMPEYGGNAADAQFLYNALTYAAMRGSGRTPLVFIPGLMGSRLFNTLSGQETEQWADVSKLASLFSFPHPLMVLELGDDGITPAKDDPAYTSIHTLPGTAGIITRLTGKAWGKNVDEAFYSTLVDYFLAHGFVENVNFWVFPYDWRRDVRSSADQLDLLIQDIHEQTGSPQVDILAHSLGGLLTRQYLSDSGRAGSVRQAILLGTPFAGTPKAFYSLLEGECLYKLPGIGYCLPKKHVLKALIPNYSSLYQILPSRHYFRLKGGGYLARSRTVDVAGPCTGCLPFEETYTRASMPPLNLNLFGGAVRFHSQLNDFTNWNGVPVTIVAGQNQQTMVGVREYTRWSWTQMRVAIVREPVYRTSGDGTVTLLSVRLANGETGLNLLGNATFRTFEADHMGLVESPEILAYLDSLLRPHSTQTTLPGEETGVVATTGAQIVVYGARAIHAHDAAGNHTGPGEEPDLVEESIPGSAYSDNGEFITLALRGGQNYIITVLPSGRQPLDIRLARATMDSTRESILYLGIPVSPDSLVSLEGDPYLADTWTLRHSAGQGSIEPVQPTSVVPAGSLLDDIPPTTSISLEGVLGEQGWYISPVTVTMHGSDDPGGSGVARIEYAFADQSQVIVYTGPFRVDPQEVSRIFSVAVDKAGNMSVEASRARIGPDKVFVPLILR